MDCDPQQKERCTLDRMRQLRKVQVGWDDLGDEGGRAYELISQI